MPQADEPFLGGPLGNVAPSKARLPRAPRLGSSSSAGLLQKKKARGVEITRDPPIVIGVNITSQEDDLRVTMTQAGKSITLPPAQRATPAAGSHGPGPRG